LDYKIEGGPHLDFFILIDGSFFHYHLSLIWLELKEMDNMNSLTEIKTS